MTRDEWLAAFALKIGVATPDEEEIEAILRLAATAAHASERTAAPVAAWLAAASGRPLDEVNDLAAEVSAE